MDLLSRIIPDPAVCHGKPVVRGLQIEQVMQTCRFAELTRTVLVVRA